MLSLITIGTPSNGRHRLPPLRAASACLAAINAPFSSSVINALRSAADFARRSDSPTIDWLLSLPLQKSEAAFVAVKLSKSLLMFCAFTTGAVISTVKKIAPSFDAGLGRLIMCFTIFLLEMVWTYIGPLTILGERWAKVCPHF